MKYIIEAPDPAIALSVAQDYVWMEMRQRKPDKRNGMVWTRRGPWWNTRDVFLVWHTRGGDVCVQWDQRVTDPMPAIDFSDNDLVEGE